MVYLALYKNIKPIANIDTLGAWIIRFATNSIYSHAELVVNDNCYSSSIQDGGTRCLPSNIVLRNLQHWDIIELPWVNEQQVLDYFDKTKGEPYGWWDLFIMYIFRLSIESKGDFCNQWCGKAIGLPNSEIYDPGKFGKLCEFITKTL